MARKTKPTADGKEKPVAAGSAAGASTGDEPKRTAEVSTLAPEAGADARPAETGPTDKPVFTSAAGGFELVEDRRFKQRAFRFKERPDDAVLAALKEHGFTYRPAEKAWTVPISAESRVLTDRLARAFAGGGPSAGRG